MDIGESVRRVLNREEIVADLFYEIFLDRFPEIQTYFIDVDLSHQAVLLTMALQMIEIHHRHNYPATRKYLHVLGHRHHRMGIPGDAYPKFRECLLVTLQRFHGNDWSETLENQWHTAITQAAQVMLEGYDRATCTY